MIPHTLRAAVLATTAPLLSASLAAQTWTVGPDVPTGSAPRTAAVAVFDGSNLFLIGGTPADGNGDAPVHRLDGGTTWTATTPLEGLFLHHGAALDGLGQIIVFAGEDTGGDPGDSYVWNEADGNAGGITERIAAPNARFAVARDLSGRVYSIGGGPGATATAGNPNSTRVERYDAASDTWTAVAPLPVAVADAAACRDAQGNLVVLGGFDADGDRTTEVQRYDVATNTWSTTALPDLPVVRSGACAVLGADDAIYLIGGSDGTEQATTLFLDPGGVWQVGPSMAAPREHFAAALDNDGFIWAIGGESTFSSEKLFTPTCPMVTYQPTNAQSYRGTTLGLEVDVAGTAPFTYQWRFAGVPLTDGVTAQGSTVVGAATAQLGVLGVSDLDAGSYDCVISNACGVTVSASIGVAVVAPASLPPAFTATKLHPGGATASSARSVDDGTIVGTTSYVHATYGTLSRPAMWPSVAPSALDLTPGNSVGGQATKVRNGTIVGWWWWPYTTPQGTGYNQHASAWNLGGAHTEMQVSGQEFGSLSDTDGMHHVGGMRFDESSTTSSGYYWPTFSRFAYGLTPPGAWGSGCSAMDAGLGFGNVNLGFGVQHAAKWTLDDRKFFDMNPPGSSRSYITAASDGLQIGSATFGGTQRTGIWAGSAGSFFELPAMSAYETEAGLIVGSAVLLGTSRAVVWHEGQLFDLHQFAPPEFSSSVAYDIDVAVDGTITVVGQGYNAALGRNEALVWQTPAPDAATVVEYGVGCPEPHLLAESLPVIGGTLDLTMENVPASTTVAAVLVGFAPLDIDVSSVFGLAGCTLLVNSAFPIGMTVTPGFADGSISMPANPSLAGSLHIFLQGAMIAPGSTPFGVALSNALDCRLGF
ncbi:MAG: hypothetical protein KDB80_13870 [Planctomycetes bacterium]|nr:hypothetical protein [Planctomycetota bacterium]